MKPEQYMEEAINLSKENFTKQYGWPFGAIIVKDWKIIWRWFNHVIKNNDPTAHWEVMAIRNACENLNTFDLSDCDIYTSCEPCPMCLWAIYWSRINKIYYGNTEKDAAEIGFDDQFFYKELAKEKHKRKIPMEQLSHKETYKVFKDRMKKNKEIHY